jgi:hypothetical protein
MSRAVVGSGSSRGRESCVELLFEGAMLAKHYDATLKDLLEADPSAWLAFLHVGPAGPIRVIDSDLATVTAAADKVLLLDGSSPSLIHVEFQASHDLRLPRRLLWYNVLLDYRHDLPVMSVAVLLRPEANSPRFDGRVSRGLPGELDHLSFRYSVVRLWEQPVEPLLEGPLGTLPLAPISDVDPKRLPDILRRLGERLEAEAKPESSARLLAATKILMGIRQPLIAVNELFQEVFGMSFRVYGIEESSVARDLIDKGIAQGIAQGISQGIAQGIAIERRLILNQGRARFGPPSQEVLAIFEGIDDPDRLEALGMRLLVVSTWDELLAEPDAPTQVQG